MTEEVCRINKYPTEKTGRRTRSFLIPCRHSRRSAEASCCLRAAACPRRENRKQDISCRPACTEKSRLPAAPSRYQYNTSECAILCHLAPPKQRKYPGVGQMAQLARHFFKNTLNPIYTVYTLCCTPLSDTFLKPLFHLCHLSRLVEKALFFNAFRFCLNGTRGWTSGTTST